MSLTGLYPQQPHGLVQHIVPEPHPKVSSSKPHLIKKIERFFVRPRWLFVRIETDTGIVGWGEGTLEGHCEAVEGSLKAIERKIVGWNAMNIEEIWNALYRTRFYRGGPVMMSAISGIDIALWDIKGQVLGVPVWELIGGKVRLKCKVYGHIGPGGPAEMGPSAKLLKDMGFTKCKMPGPLNVEWLDDPTVLDETVARVQAVKAAGIDFAMDFHGRCHKGMAKQLASLLAPYRPFFIEEPILPGLIAEQKELYGLTSIPIALGERLYHRSEVRPYLENACIDLIQPDLAHAGGITEVKKIAAMAEAYDVGLAPHCPIGPIALAACLHVGFSTQSFVVQEMVIKGPHNQSQQDIYSYLHNPDMFKVENGMIDLFTRPGLGVIINEELVRAEHAMAMSGETPFFVNPTMRCEDGSIQEW